MSLFSNRLTHPPHAGIPALVKYEPHLHVVLHEPEIPQNAGNVGRTCVAVGAKLWFVRPLGFQLEDRYLRRAGLDYWKLLNWEAVDDFSTVTRRLGNAGFWYFTKTATKSYSEVRFEQGDALVFGSETKGLPPEMLAHHADRCVRIPMRPDIRSLNLSNSVAVAVYEAIRQWGDGAIAPWLR
jgi:tRNA (cytidine/uridine-2'-O-)-methyltransferase